jgi:hypothetical protein
MDRMIAARESLVRQEDPHAEAYLSCEYGEGEVGDLENLCI